ncbi:hypothetical protein [Zhongshania sp.]|uniref:hypothetical protein n=1 Tax=Zhongshania sp. TaxID=1971902 RepID=UPI001B3F289D|nr:hypothetical protein [Zhongshania sp.]MBQ0794872.1 hypothetical protein [Zhongshania sp.]
MKKLSIKPVIAATALALSSSLSNAQFLGLPIPSIGELAPAGLVTSLTAIGVGEGLPVVTTLLFSSPLTPAVVGLAPQASALTGILLGNPLTEIGGLIPTGGDPLQALIPSGAGSPLTILGALPL